MKQENPFVKSGFYKWAKNDDGRWIEFVPHFYSTLEDCKKGISDFLTVSPSKILIIKKDDQFSFIPAVGTADTVIHRMSTMFNAEIVDEINCFKI